MRRTNATHTASLAIRITGPHDPHASEVDGKVQLLIPGAAITIADQRAARTAYHLWAEARRVARRTFAGAKVTTMTFPQPPQLVTAAVLLRGDQRRAVAVTGRAPSVSPSGVGQLAVRIGALTIACDDRAAWESQDQGWRAAYTIAADLWPQLARVENADRHADRTGDRWQVITRPKR